MANTFYTPEQAARTAASLVGLDSVLSQLVTRDFEADFNSGTGATVNVPVPGALPSRTRGVYDKSTPVTMDEIAEQTIAVTLTTHAYSAVSLSEGDLDLEIEDFARQVLSPQARAVAAYAERALVTAMQATPETTTIAWDAAAPAKTFTAMRSALRTAGVPADSRLIAVVGVDIMGALLDGPTTTFDANGKVRGFEIVESNRLAADEIIAFTPAAFALAVRAPKVPQGAGYGASVSEQGFALRYLRDYDATVLADRSVVSAFVGAQAMPLAVVDETAGTVDLVANGGAVRVLTSTIPA